MGLPQSQDTIPRSHGTGNKTSNSQAIAEPEYNRCLRCKQSDEGQRPNIPNRNMASIIINMDIYLKQLMERPPIYEKIKTAMALGEGRTRTEWLKGPVLESKAI